MRVISDLRQLEAAVDPRRKVLTLIVGLAVFFIGLFAVTGI